MRRLLPLLALLLWPVAAHAAEAGALLDKSIKAIWETSFQAKMRFLSQFESGQMREVRIYHVAPDRYRIEPLSSGRPSGGYFVENSDELLWVNGDLATRMPQRQFSINDMLTIHFLRELGKTPGTTVLEGRVGERAAFMLRHASAAGGYEVTVGVDQQTHYPLYLMVTDRNGRTRVYYEMQSIEYRTAGSLPPSLFTVPRSQMRNMPARPTSGAQLASLTPALPLYPGWLPPNYRIGTVNLLSCPRADDKDCALVYQLEAHGPRITDIVSIFQMQAEGAEQTIRSLSLSPNAGYVVMKNGPWVVAVFGDLQQEELAKVAKHLTRRDDRVRTLLEETRVLDRIREQAMPTQSR